MNKFTTTLWFFLVFGLFLPLVSGDTINLSKTSSDSRFPQISIDRAGLLLVVWEEEDWPIPGIADILYSIYNEGTWTNIQDSVSQLYDARSPQLAYSHSDKQFYLAYEDGPGGSSRDILYRRYDSNNDGFWSNIDGVQRDSFDNHSPYISLDQTGRIHVIWIQAREDLGQSGILMKSKQESYPWPDSFDNISGNTPSAKSSPRIQVQDGDIYACWMDDQSGFWDIIFTERTAGAWKTPDGLEFPGEKKWPSLTVDTDSTLHLLYSTALGNTCYTQRKNGIWSSPQIISIASSPSGISDLMVFKNNTLHAVWIQEATTGTAVYYGRGDTHGRWLEPIKAVSGKNIDHPHLELDDAGDAHIVWEDTGINGRKDILYTKITLPGEKPSANISSSKETGIIPFTVDFEATSTASSTDDTLNFWWDFGDGTKMEEGQGVTHTYYQAGDYVVRLYATNASLLSSLQKKSLAALTGPLPPINIQVKKTEEGGLFFREKINALTWEANPENNSLAPVEQYFIYRKSLSQEDSEFERIGQIDYTVLRYADRGFIFPEDRDSYAYAVSSVDNLDREGPKESAVNKN